MSDGREDREENPLITLEQAGARYERLELDTTVTYMLAGVVISSNREVGLRYDWRIPVPTGVEASFSHETLREKFKKIFRHELEVQDPEFDEAVFIATEDEETTARFLMDEETRRIIRAVVEPGGTIVLTQSRVLYEWSDPGEETQGSIFDMARFVARVIAFDPTPSSEKIDLGG